MAEGNMRPSREEQRDAETERLEAEIVAADQDRINAEADRQADIEEQMNEPVKKEGEHDYQKRFRDTQSWARREMNNRDKTIKEQEAYIEELKVRAERPNNSEIPTDPEAYEEWAKEFPDSAKMIETAIAKRMDNYEERIRASEKRLTEVANQTAAQKVHRDLAKKHTDWSDIKKSDEYADWVDSLTARHQKALYADDATAEDLIGYIDMFKAQTGWGAKSTPSRKQNTDDPRMRSTGKPAGGSSNSKGKYLESDVARMSGSEFAKHADAIDAARASGNFVYDLSEQP